LDLDTRRLLLPVGSERGTSTLSWLRLRREQAERIEVEAGALIEAFGRDAYGEARWREQTASSDFMADEWRRVALVVARKTGPGQHIDLETAIHIDAKTDSGVDGKTSETRAQFGSSDRRSWEKLRLLLSRC
jgi:hypothetical protein